MKRQIVTVMLIVLLAVTCISNLMVTKVQSAPPKPTVDIVSPTNGKSIWGLFSMRGTLSVPDGDSIVSLVWSADGGPSKPIDISTEWIVSMGPFHPGYHNFTVSAQNHTGYQCSDKVMLKIENTGPKLDLTSPNNGAYLSGNVTFSGTATDLEGPMTKGSIRFNYPTQYNSDFDIIDGNWSIVVDLSKFKLGPTYVQIDFTDSDGQTSGFWLQFTIGTDPGKPVKPPHHLNLTVQSPMNGTINGTNITLVYNIDWAPPPGDIGDRLYMKRLNISMSDFQFYSWYTWEGNHTLNITLPRTFSNYTLNITASEGGLVSTRILSLKGNWTSPYSNGTSPQITPTETSKLKMTEDQTIWFPLMVVMMVVLLAVVAYRYR